MMYLIVDGMLHGTGIRNKYEGGYLNLDDLHLPNYITEKILVWLKAYEEEHFSGFQDNENIKRLDDEGVVIMRQLQEIFPAYKFSYYSSAQNNELE